MKRLASRAAVVLVVLLVVAQFVPMARTNPPSTRDVRWDSPETRALAERACFDCHSNSTAWPWYSHVAPVSFFVINHVNEGRRRLNFSAWDTPQRATFQDVEKTVTDGDMPIWNYVLMHPPRQTGAGRDAASAERAADDVYAGSARPPEGEDHLAIPC